MSLNHPKFITFEGGEGSGKSTQSKLLYEYLVSKDIPAIHTREIGGTKEAESIRELLIYSELLPISELLLVMAARYEHINKVIIPALLAGTWVICDRFIDSTACYQSGKHGLTIERIYQLHKELMTYSNNQTIKNLSHLQGGIMPDITFFMDVPPAIGLQRVASRGDANKFEEKNYDFHQQVYDKFKQISELYKDRVTVINCQNKTINEIQNDVVGRIFSSVE